MKKIGTQRKPQPNIEIERLKLKLTQEKNRYAELVHYYTVLKQKCKRLEQAKEKRRFFSGKKQ
jgi:hypothetical protein